jgi:hypothetical protein
VPQCVHCSSDIKFSARICPYCHLCPFNAFKTEPYPPIRSDGSGFDPLMAGLLGGMVILPVFPVVGGVLLGGSVLYAVWTRVKG